MDKSDIPPEHELYLQSLRSAYDGGKELRIPTNQVSRNSSPVRITGENNNLSNLSEVCDKVRKWGVKYDGGKDPLCFLERIEELASCYAIPTNTLLNYMPELLKGDALAWYRNNKKAWNIYRKISWKISNFSSYQIGFLKTWTTPLGIGYKNLKKVSSTT